MNNITSTPVPEAGPVALYDPESAAERLKEIGMKVSGRWLRDGVNHDEFPHTRAGRKLFFSDAHLAAIQEMKSHDNGVKPNRRKSRTSCPKPRSRALSSV
ncbi:hypothetical protein [Embleya sp. NPDC005971]|uniref:hypothetical protein n=1 Tax=Embleya sp. NPDC005971 TaxID=3156724 RepID=UPI0033FDC41B